MKAIRILIVLMILTLTLQVDLQGQADKNGLMFRTIFVDYQSPQGGNTIDFKEWNSGLQVAYLRKFGDKVTLAVPFSAYSVRFYESQTNTTIYNLGAELQFQFLKEKHKLNPYIGLGVGAETEKFDDTYVRVPLFLGTDIMVGTYSSINLELGYALKSQENRNNVQATLGFKHFFGKDEPVMEVMEAPLDSDGDGIPDDADLCPQRPGLVEFFGCPDSDGDGLPDDMDDCPEQPGPKELNGCPDSDGDGLRDQDDECPNIAGPIENKGCPITDRDGDGIDDVDDRCPDVPGPAALAGCPDRDGDGVADIDDRCPDTPGTIENKGCPEIHEDDRQILEFAVQNVEFDFGKASLKQSSFSLLDQITNILRKYPAYSLRISGHTDSVGSDSRNQELSEQRARSCYEYLISKGIQAKRLSYIGFGETKPIASNENADGRSRNRRVEFDLFVE